jgi:hypothetical protein
VFQLLTESNATQYNNIYWVYTDCHNFWSTYARYLSQSIQIFNDRGNVSSVSPAIEERHHTLVLNSWIGAAGQIGTRNYSKAYNCQSAVLQSCWRWSCPLHSAEVTCRFPRGHAWQPSVVLCYLPGYSQGARLLSSNIIRDYLKRRARVAILQKAA